MNALKITIDNKEIIYGQPSENGVATLIISIGKDDSEFRIDGRGFDPNKEITYEWIKNNIKDPSKVIIEFLSNVSISEYSDPITQRQSDSQNFANKKKVEYYYNLKKELEEKGLI